MTDWEPLFAEARALLEGETDRIANAANLAALMWMRIPELNWAGFYFYDGKELVLGPFQGKPACIRIGLGKGVCGTAAQKREPVVVADVHQFAGHIPCDADSNSELVVPLVRDDKLIGVIDLDSPRRGRFGAQDQAGVEALARIWLEASR